MTGTSCICHDCRTDTQGAVAVLFNTSKGITEKAGQFIFTKILWMCISCGELLIFSQHLSMCIPGKLFSLFLPKICPCASREESCSFFVQHLLVCIIGEAVADFYTKSGNVHHDCTCKEALNMCRNNGSDKH